MDSSGIDLFTPFKAGKLDLSHRVVMAPLTRCRAICELPNAAHVKYYSQRTTEGGLIISEGTLISNTAAGYPNTPGIYTDEQVEAWKKVIDAVHAKGGIFFCQLWHVGRASNQDYQPGGAAPISSTNRILSDKFRPHLPGDSYGSFSKPQALETAEVGQVVEHYRQAAANAIRAGFDGVEIHGAYGYLIDQFLKQSINDRTDIYGGSTENRCRFLLEIIRAVADEIGLDRVGLKIQPEAEFNGATDPDPLNLGLAIIERVNALQVELGSSLSYLQLPRPWSMAREEQKLEESARMHKAWRDVYRGVFMAVEGYTGETGNKAVADGAADLVAFGRGFISNPDFVHRLKNNAPLNPYSREAFYSPDPVLGYTDYPFLDDASERTARP
ncbi:hypothetical protein MLD38_006944 [Melastoma candidum]|uniref:Uncharacterized protein n=1 Tax=Melastoma candidum TaxID=119954 RepID=A0ACB9RSJ6_9MYRT|nr:hypothetical protein MLD38_006944 [Melastoma candidum]